MSSSLICPQCDKKLSHSKHYDPTFEWFECPKCEGCFTYDEILEGGGAALEESNGRREPERIAPVAKKKKKGRRTEIVEEEEPVEVVEAEKIRGEMPSGQIIQIMADELQEIYNECGRPIDRVNAEDKTINLVRHMKFRGKVHFKEKDMSIKYCKEHK